MRHLVLHLLEPIHEPLASLLAKQIILVVQVGRLPLDALLESDCEIARLVAPLVGVEDRIPHGQVSNKNGAVALDKRLN